jgi:hypothetical protein
MKIRLKHLVEDRDRYGNIRIYVRVPGRRKVRIRAPTDEFVAAYNAAVSDHVTAPRQAREAKPGSFRHLCVLYRISLTLHPGFELLIRHATINSSAFVASHPISQEARMTETNVSFHTFRGARLAAMLHLPDQGASAPVPGVVLCQGLSGVKHLMLPQIAAHLDSHGLASLRFDYCGYGESEGERGGAGEKAQ